MDTRAKSRADKIACRKKISREDWMVWTAAISESVVHHPLFVSSDAICCYVDVQGEVGTRQIMETAWAQAKTVAVPKVLGINEMAFFIIHNFAELSVGYKGILEPVRADEISTWEPGQNTLMVMPCVAFDNHCNRLGYGGGYYDHYLSKHPHINTLGLAFELQRIPTIHPTKFDVPPQWIITEEKEYQR